MPSVRHLENGVFSLLPKKGVYLRNSPGLTAYDIIILFYTIVHMVLDYKNPEFEFDSLTLSFYHNLTFERTEN